MVILIYRDDVYNRDPNSPDAGTAELILAKQRNGPTGTVKLAFLREQTRFANLAPGGAKYRRARNAQHGGARQPGGAAGQLPRDSDAPGRRHHARGRRRSLPS